MKKTPSWVKPTHDRTKTCVTNENKFSDQETGIFYNLLKIISLQKECGNISKRSETRNSFHNSDFTNINKVYKTTNVLAEEFRTMIKNDRELFLQEYNKIENKIMTLMETLKN